MCKGQEKGTGKRQPLKVIKRKRLQLEKKEVGVIYCL